MRRTIAWMGLAFAVVGCSSDDSPSEGSGGASPGSGATAGSGSGAAAGSGGAPGSGGGSASGSTTASGGTSSSSGGAGPASGGAGSGGDTGSGGAAVAPGTPLIDRIVVKDVTAPAGVKAGVNNWRIWGSKRLAIAPVFTVPYLGCQILVGFTTSEGNTPTARVAVIGADGALLTTHTLEVSRELRGLAAEGDGHFAALLWDDAADKIYVTRFDTGGKAGWSEELTNPDNKPDDFNIGESRLEFGNGRYGAYYHVHSNSGHEGDTLKWVNASTGAETTEWAWGCSHSMSNLLRYGEASSQFLPVCVTDCYPGTNGDFAVNAQGGIYLNHNDRKVMDVNAGCNGKVAGELGGLAPSQSDWKLVLNAHQNPMTKGQSSYVPGSMNQDIGFASVTRNSSSAVVWLTTTPTINEADSAIAAFRPREDTTEQYVAGWAEPGTSKVFKLARLGAGGDVLEGPVDVTARAKWGERDDPFRTMPNGDVVWAWFDSAGSTTLHVARVSSGVGCGCSPGTAGCTM